MPADSSISTISINDESLWDPQETLRLGTQHTCVGYAKSKGRRCQMSIGSARWSKIKYILDMMARSEPDAELLLPLLRDLAYVALCPQSHQSQAGSVVQDWQAMIVADYLRESGDEVEEEGEIQEEPEDDVGAEPESHREEEYEDEPEDAIEEDADADNAVLPAPPARVQTDEISSLELNPISRTNTTLSVRQRCTETHVRRRSYNDDCPICCESMTTCGMRALVWCKSSCGKSVHRECFRRWRESRTDESHTVNCIYCRRPWEDPCEHDLNLPSVH